MTRKRIVSLLPGATEWVCKLGLADWLVGVSHECDYPGCVSDLPKVTRSRINRQDSSADIDRVVREHSDARTPLFELDAEKIESLKPDLILTQTLCNVCAVSEADVRQSLGRIGDGCELVDLRAMTFDQVIQDAELILQKTGASDQPLQRLRERIIAVRDRRAEADRSAEAKRSAETGSPPSVTLLEWTDPLFCAGHWTPQLIDWAGGHDPIGRSGQPSRQIEFQELLAADPAMLLVACCGLPAQRGQKEWEQLVQDDRWSQLSCVQNQQVHVFDGSAWFNRPGPRLVDALEAVAGLIHDTG